MSKNRVIKRRSKVGYKKRTGRMSRRIDIGRRIKRRKGSEKKTNKNKTKLTRRRKEILFKAVALGLSRTSACAIAGINTSTFRQYMDYGKDRTLKKYRFFAEKIISLEAQREYDALEVITKCSKGGYKIKKTKIKQGIKGMEIERTVSTMAPQWHAAAWFLERKLKDEWGRDSVQQTKTPEEYAQEINMAARTLFGSVPLAPQKEQLSE
jgi:hypothetical protein